MKLTSILISMLVFLMSGVMCLFSSSQVHAQNNARREFKFHQENIRTKKRNNDLQKTRRGKVKISKNKIRIRYTSGEGNGEGYAFPEWKNYAKTKSFAILYNSFGIGLNSHEISGCKEVDYESYKACNNNLTKKPFYWGNVNSLSYLYNIGDSIFLTFKGYFIASGEVNKLDEDEGYEITLTEINSHYDILPFVHSIQFGIKISNLEIIIEKDYSEYYFKHKDGKVIMRAGGITLLGLGYVF